jgi:uncharacterized protein
VKRLVISIHDVAPSTIPAAERLRARVAERVGGPVSLLVVPRYGGRESLRAGRAPQWLRERAGQGDELVLHGYSHVDRSGRDGRELSGRDPGAIGALIRDGVAELATAGLTADGFIAPSYAHPRAADAACRAAGLSWWATRGSLRSAGGRRALPSISLGASTGARRALSPWVADGAVRALTALPAVRLDLHPADVGFRRLARAADGLLDRLLDQGRLPVTHEGLQKDRPPPDVHAG